MDSLNQNNSADKILVSVIIPVYNTADYIKQTVESICNQTLRNIEILLINDGSTDNSLDIMQEMSTIDSRIKVFSQHNQGPSVSRNVGINNAKGQYIYFMDSDDLLESNTLETCYNECLNNQLDFAYFDAKAFTDDNDLDVPDLKYNRQQHIDSNILYRGIDSFNKQVKEWCYTPSVCLLFINLNFLKSIHLSFYHGIIHEDQLFTAQLYLAASRTKYLPYLFYNRRFRKNSIMTTPFRWKNISSYLVVADNLLILAQNSNQEISHSVNLFLEQMLNAAVWNAHILPLKERLKLFKIISKAPYLPLINNKTRFALLLKKYLK